MSPDHASATGQVSTLLEAFAAEIAKEFPELEGRAFAVSEIEVTKENIPTLPLAMTSLIREKADHSWRSNNLEITEDLVAELWLPANRITDSKGNETPFWAFYDYEAIRDKMLNLISAWETPRVGRLKYISMDIESSQFAVMLSFRFEHEFKWCRRATPDDGGPLLIASKIIPHTDPVVACDCETPQSCGKCHLT